MSAMRTVLLALPCAWLLAACASSTPPAPGPRVPTLPARPSALLAIPPRPIPPAEDPPTQAALGSYAFELLGHVILLETQLQELGAWWDETAARRDSLGPSK